MSLGMIAIDRECDPQNPNNIVNEVVLQEIVTVEVESDSTQLSGMELFGIFLGFLLVVVGLVICLCYNHIKDQKALI